MGPRRETTVRYRTPSSGVRPQHGLSEVGEVFEDESARVPLRQDLVRRPMQQGNDPIRLPTVVSSEDRPLVPQVLREVPLDRLPFSGHRFLDPLDRSEVDPVKDPVGGGEVGGVEVEVDADLVLRPDLDVVGNPKVEQKRVRAQSEPEVPLGGRSIFLEQGVSDRREFDHHVEVVTDRDVEEAPRRVPSVEIPVEAGLELTPMGTGAAHSVEPLGVVSASPTEGAVPGAEHRRGLGGHGDTPGRGQVRVGAAEDWVRPFRGGEPGLVRVGAPVTDEAVHAATEVEERPEEGRFEAVGDNDRADGEGPGRHEDETPSEPAGYEDARVAERWRRVAPGRGP